MRVMGRAVVGGCVMVLDAMAAQLHIWSHGSGDCRPVVVGAEEAGGPGEGGGAGVAEIADRSPTQPMTHGGHVRGPERGLALQSRGKRGREERGAGEGGEGGREGHGCDTLPWGTNDCMVYMLL
jgi:hypothetical protein